MYHDSSNADIEPVEFFEIHLQNLLPEFIHNQCKSEVFGPINPVQDVRIVFICNLYKTINLFSVMRI